MVSITADPVIIVNETPVDTLSCHELRHHPFVLVKNGPEPVRLSLLVTENIHRITTFKTLADICGKQLEILVEYRLRDDIELDSFFLLQVKRDIQENPLEPFGFTIEITALVRVRRVHPDDSIFRENFRDFHTPAIHIFLGNHVRKNVG